LDGQDVRTFSSDGLHIGNVTFIGGRGDHVWAVGQLGFAIFDGRRFHTIVGESDAEFKGISGVVETDNGDFWSNQSTGVARIPAAEVASRMHDVPHELRYQLFDFRDGVPGSATPIGPLPAAVLAGDGRIWMSGSNGTYWVDPARMYRNPIPPPVTIEGIYAGNTRYDPSAMSRLPVLPSNVRIEYTALSLSVPERVRFRYLLEGVDDGWQDAGTRRTAYYTKLPPGQFRFHVIACNNDGVWNQTGSVALIAVPSAFFQTSWFMALCVCAVGGLLWGAYLLRMRSIAAQLNGRLEVRVAERTRIARELHDTLLQSFQGLMLRLQVVNKLLPEGKAKEQLEKTLERGDQAIAEGRSAVLDLRSCAFTVNNLSEAVNAAGNELSGENRAAFDLVVEGPPRDLQPIIRDELYCIAREALRNAFTHARALHIEAEISYGQREFRLRVRDDGEGIPPEILEQGRPGHYGLPGIRERARQIGAELTVWSRAGSGTEIELRLPASIAYGTSPLRFRFRAFRRKWSET
jgi:signal transduction histidine kinase